MAISVSQAFKRTSANPVDETLTLTKAEMLAINDNLMPSKYLTVCQDDGFIYLYDKSATPNQTTGKFTKFEGGGQVDTSKLYSTDDSASIDLADTDFIPFYDTSASAKKKTLWSNIKTVLENTFQPKLTAGNNVTITDNTISASAGVIGVWSKGDIYSTTEKVIGCWTDGRPIYQKVVNFGAAPKNTPKIVNHGISNLGTVVEARAFTASTSEDNIQSNWAAISEGSFSLSYNKTSVIMTTRSGAGQYEDWSSFYPTVYVVMQYTKTSDAANSYNYSDENDYSTSEKLIGKWVDGSNLYQRTFTGYTSTSSLFTDIVAFSSSYVLRSVEGAFKQESSGCEVPIVYSQVPDNNDWMNCYHYNGYITLAYGENNKGKEYWVTVKYTK